MCESSVSFFLREKGVGLGSVYDYTSSSVEEFRARQARTRLYCAECVSPWSVSTSGSGLWLLGKRAPFGEGAPLWGRARPFGGGRAPLGEGMFTLTWWVSEGAPLLQRARPFGKGLFQSVTMYFNLLIQHTVSRWCSSGCVHERCGSVHHWLLTEVWCLPDFLL